SGDDDTPRWLPTTAMPENSALNRKVLGVFWRSLAYAAFFFAVFAVSVVAVPQVAEGTFVVTSFVGFLGFAVTAAKRRARYGETRRTGWRRACADVGVGGAVITLRFRDRSRSRLGSAWSTRRVGRFGVGEHEVWVGGVGEDMVVVFGRTA